MSRYLSRNDDGSYLEEIECMDECKWKINEMCCNDSSPYLGDFYCSSNLKRICYEEEDGIIEN